MPVPALAMSMLSNPEVIKGVNKSAPYLLLGFCLTILLISAIVYSIASSTKFLGFLKGVAKLAMIISGACLGGGVLLFMLLHNKKNISSAMMNNPMMNFMNQSSSIVSPMNMQMVGY